MRGCGNALAGWGCGLLILLVVAIGAVYWLALPKLDLLLEDSLRRAYMLPPSSTVIVEHGSLLDTAEGQVKRVYVESPESKLDGIVVTDLRLLAEGVDFDLVKTLATRSAELDEATHGEISFIITESSLQEVWADELRSQGLTNAAVDITAEGVSLTGTADLKLAQVPVVARGKFTAQTDQRVKLELGQFELSGVELPSGELQQALSALAPEIGLSRFKMDIEIDEITHTDGAVEVAARTRSLEDRLKAHQEEQATEVGATPSVAGQRLKLPKLDELVELFVEQEPDSGRAAQVEGDGETPPQGGETEQGEPKQAGNGHE